MDRAEVVHQNFLRRVAAADLPVVNGPALVESGLGTDGLISLFRAQVSSRQLDRISRKLQAKGQGFYTIGSSGHEGNAAIAAALRVTDPAFLHYRDAAFQIARAGQVEGQDPIRDMLHSFTASIEDPMSGGRHKVLGSVALNIPPQTSTIASHLPKSVGAAFSIDLARRSKSVQTHYPKDAIAMCSFGDASLNHSTAQGALNTAGWTAFKGMPMALLFVCEDNGIGISTKTPDGWVAASVQNRPGLRYFHCNGLDLVDTFRVARQAIDWIRRTRKPAFLHMSCVRLYGHAGPDMEISYRAKEEIELAEANDPLLHSAARLLESNALTKIDIVAIYQEIEKYTLSISDEIAAGPKLETAEQVMAAIIPPKRAATRVNGPANKIRAASFGAADLRALKERLPMNKLINLGLSDLMLTHPEIIMAGEDIGKKGGVYGITKGLQSRFGRSRVIDTLLDEQSILGLGIGMAHNGFIPMPEIQFLAYLHNAEDQLRGEAATLPFFSNGQFANPMVIRIAGLGYQKGFGGHFHNDNSLAVLRDIPGIIIGCPSNGSDAVRMYREAVRLARQEARVVVIIEPIALYPMRDLHHDGDGKWMRDYPAPNDIAPLDQVGISGKGKDLAIVTYGNGAYLSRQAEKLIDARVRVIDLMWLAPLPQDALIAALKDCKHVLIVDECRKTGSQSEALMALFSGKLKVPFSRYTATDSFIATGPAYGATLPCRDGIVDAAHRLIGK